MPFTIKELESLTGIKAHTIRIWEQRYNFLKPTRTETNIRSYNNEELKTLLTVALLNKYGYKISKIDEMVPDQRAHAILKLSNQEASHESIVNEMIGYMIEMDSFNFEILLNRHIQIDGLEKTLTGIIFFFLERIGILWQTNQIAPVQEHIVSNIIRQKIISAIEELSYTTNQRPIFLLFLPEDEHHELGLLFIYFLLKRKNVNVIYLGANVPLKDIEYLISIKRPDFLYMHLSSMPKNNNLKKYLLSLSGQSHPFKMLLSGSIASNHLQNLTIDLTYLPSLKEVNSYISTI
ncbi:MAG: hypothetical protein NVS9B7_14790 [Flavisolibacter sp.]